VQSCKNFKEDFRCYEQCPDQKYNFRGKCVTKCPKEAAFINGKSCVAVCPFYHVGNLVCRNNCPKNYFPHGKQCKSDCPSSSPFYTNDFDVKKCMKECPDYMLATEDKHCIYELDCSGFRDDIWCLSKCRPQRFIFRPRNKTYCYPMVPVYAAITLLSIIVIVNVAYGIRILSLCYHIRQVSNHFANSMVTIMTFFARLVHQNWYRISCTRAVRKVRGQASISIKVAL
jgi:hypothetical protein